MSTSVNSSGTSFTELGGQHVLNEHDTRYPDACPLVGGPYLNGYIPSTAILLSTPSTASNQTSTNTGAAATTFNTVSAATIAGEQSSGDRVGVVINYHTEDHQSIAQP